MSHFEKELGAGQSSVVRFTTCHEHTQLNRSRFCVIFFECLASKGSNHSEIILLNTAFHHQLSFVLI